MEHLRDGEVGYALDGPPRNGDLMALQWVKFTDQAAYNAYAAASCAAAGIPKPGQRQSDGTTMLGNCWTTALIQPMLDGSTIVAQVPSTDIPLYGLTPYLLKSTVQPAGFTVYQPKPATWQGQPVP